MQVFFILLSMLAATVGETQDMPGTASRYFKEAKAISDKDNGKCWGHKLYGPMIFVDKQTGMAVANEPDSAGSFQKNNDVFVGTVPKNFGSNTAVPWGGKLWTVILWPLPADKYERANIMMHELFHQLQLRIGLPAPSPALDHLDKFEGRLLLNLELEAFRKVINNYPHFSRADLQNALAMRLYRYQKFPQADSLEHLLETNEGMATFTGFTLSGLNEKDAKQFINKKINEFYTNQTYVRSLGYVTGYLYGYLLSKKNPEWNKNIAKSFHQQLAELYKLELKPPLENAYADIAQKNKYGYAGIYAAEKSREEKRILLQAANRKKFVEGPVLELPTSGMNINFNPNEVQVLEGVGPIYPSLTIKADWGMLEVTKGGALIKDWMTIYIPLPPDFKHTKNLQTSDWKLELKNGWTITPGKRNGDYKVIKQ